MAPCQSGQRWSSSRVSQISVVWGSLSLAVLLVSVLTNSWVDITEPVQMPHYDGKALPITFRIGLWKVCPYINKSLAFNYSVPVSPCASINYFKTKNLCAKDLRIRVPVEFTPSFVNRVRLSTPFELVSVMLIIIATILTLAGHFNEDKKILFACGLYILGGLSLGGGLVVFVSVLNDEYYYWPRMDKERDLLFSYQYGWSFFAALAAFIMAELSALICVTAYLQRFTSTADMVKVIPGMERRLQQHSREALLGKHNRDTLVANDSNLDEGVEGPLLKRQVGEGPPDICHAGEGSKSSQPDRNTFSELRASKSALLKLAESRNSLQKKSVTIGTFTTMEPYDANYSSTV